MICILHLQYKRKLVYGAKTSAYKINPEVGIALDVTGSGDIPKAKPFAVNLDKGTL